jgi:hypothetical protein
MEHPGAGFAAGILGGHFKSHPAKVRLAFHYFCSMLDLTQPIVFWIAFGALSSAVFLQLVVWLGVFSRVAWASKKPEIQARNLPPLTLLADGRNEEEEFPPLMEAWSQQKYPGRVDWVAINDQSMDDTEQVLDGLRQRYAQLHQVLVPRSERFYDSKKFPITLGIKAAKTEAVLLTHAHARPVSDQWAALMAEPMADPEVRLVLGVVRMESAPGWWAANVRFAHAMRQLEYLSWAKAGLVLAGDGANLAYQRSLFFEHKGFLSHMHISSGDDDLFVNEAAPKTKVRVVLHPDAHTTVPLPMNKDRWMRRRKDHAQARGAYRPATRLALQFDGFAQGFYALMVLATAVLIPFVPTWWMFWLALVGGRTLVVWVQWALVGRFLALRGLVALFPLLEWVFWLQRTGLAIRRTFTPANKRW